MDPFSDSRASGEKPALGKKARNKHKRAAAIAAANHRDQLDHQANDAAGELLSAYTNTEKKKIVLEEFLHAPVAPNIIPTGKDVALEDEADLEEAKDDWEDSDEEVVVPPPVEEPADVDDEILRPPRPSKGQWTPSNTDGKMRYTLEYMRPFGKAHPGPPPNFRADIAEVMITEAPAPASHTHNQRQGSGGHGHGNRGGSQHQGGGYNQGNGGRDGYNQGGGGRDGYNQHNQHEHDGGHQNRNQGRHDSRGQGGYNNRGGGGNIRQGSGRDLLAGRPSREQPRLHTAANAWSGTKIRDVDQEASLLKETISLLNKLTLEKFDGISDKLMGE